MKVRASRFNCKWDPGSPAYLRTTLGITSREYFTKAYLRPLTEAGLIVRMDPDHPHSPRQEYALTRPRAISANWAQ